MPSTTSLPHLRVGKNFTAAFEAYKAQTNPTITQTELGELLSVDQSTITYWKRRGVSPEYSKDVANLLSVSERSIARPSARYVDKVHTPLSTDRQPRTKSIDKIQLAAAVLNSKLTNTQCETLSELIKVMEAA